MTSSVAGLMLVNVPASPSTSLPSIIILVSKRTVRVSGMLFALLGLRIWCSHVCRRRTAQCAESGDSQDQAQHVLQAGTGEQPVRDQQHARVWPDRSPDERRPAIERLGESRREAFRRASTVLHGESPTLVHGAVVGGVRAAESRVSVVPASVMMSVS